MEKKKIECIVAITRSTIDASETSSMLDQLLYLADEKLQKPENGAYYYRFDELNDRNFIDLVFELGGLDWEDYACIALVGGDKFHFGNAMKYGVGTKTTISILSPLHI